MISRMTDATDAPGAPAPLATQPLVAALVDDAGLFPPSALAMDDAVARHRADLDAAHPVHTGRFLCPASRLDELRQALREGETVDVGVILDGPLASLPGLATSLLGDPRLHLGAVELRLPQDQPLDEAVAAVVAATSALPDAVTAYVEIPLAQADEGETRAALTAVHDAGLGAKVRCGGVTPELFPSVDQLADLLAAAGELGARFKCTAGLHHAVRYTDHRTGFEHHGVLNILVALLRAVAGADRQQVVEALASTDGPALAAEALAAADDEQRRVRAGLVAYGSCSTGRPVEDLAALGLTSRVEVLERRDPTQQVDQQQ